MSGAPRVALAGLLLVACGGPEYDLARVPERTEVLLLASVHGRHLDEDLDYPSEELAALLRAAEPDVIVAELPPAGEARVRAALAAGEADPWLEAFPELREVVFPVAAGGHRGAAGVRGGGAGGARGSTLSAGGGAPGAARRGGGPRPGVDACSGALAAGGLA